MTNKVTVYDRVKMGALMGGLVGLGLGFFVGNIQYLMYGATRRGGYMGNIGASMLTSAGTFAFFLSIGSVIRSQPRNEKFY